MGSIRFFWDTYALIEFTAGNPGFARFSQDPVTITLFNLVELYWVALREYGENEAEKIYDEYKACVVEVDDQTLKEAIKFRKQVYKNSKVSYADAIGYVYALRNNMVFLTGDKEFEDLDNVEFVRR